MSGREHCECWRPGDQPASVVAGSPCASWLSTPSEPWCSSHLFHTRTIALLDKPCQRSPRASACCARCAAWAPCSPIPAGLTARAPPDRRRQITSLDGLVPQASTAQFRSHCQIYGGDMPVRRTLYVSPCCLPGSASLRGPNGAISPPNEHSAHSLGAALAGRRRGSRMRPSTCLAAASAAVEIPR
jgi:hypothetical protein